MLCCWGYIWEVALCLYSGGGAPYHGVIALVLPMQRHVAALVPLAAKGVRPSWTHVCNVPSAARPCIRWAIAQLGLMRAHLCARRSLELGGTTFEAFFIGLLGGVIIFASTLILCGFCTFYYGNARPLRQHDSLGIGKEERTQSVPVGLQRIASSCEHGVILFCGPDAEAVGTMSQSVSAQGCPLSFILRFINGVSASVCVCALSGI